MVIAKFDVLYPPEYLKQKQAEHHEDIDPMDFKQYLAWLHSLKMGLYDIFGRELSKAGWSVHEYYQQDEIFLRKLCKRLNLKINVWFFLKRKNVRYWWDTELKLLFIALRKQKVKKKIRHKIILKKYLEYIKPNVIFLREPCQIDNLFWKPYKNNVLIASMIGCNISHPINWQPHISDIIFTLTPEYVDFFNLNLVESHLIEYAIDPQTKEERESEGKIYDITFIGKLGSTDQKRKSETMEAIANRFDFKWWGPKGEIMEQYPNLLRSWQGVTAGKEMMDIYVQSKIVINDYVHSNGSYSVNMRMKEVMGAGTFLLTRQAKNTKELDQENILSSYTDIDSCLNQIDYYLTNENDRESKAEAGWKYVVDNHGYAKVLETIRSLLQKKYNEKFPDNT